MTWTLSSYVIRRFLGMLFTLLLIVIVLITLIDMVELLRRGANRGASFGQIMTLALLHALPVVGQTFPFVFMLSAIGAFTRLSRSSELVVTRAAGVSVWRLLAPVVLTSALLGVVTFSVYSPIAAATMQRFETLEARYFRGQESLLSLSKEGLWLRQGGPRGQTVIRARSASPDGIELRSVTLFSFGDNSLLLTRIQARLAMLGDGSWQLLDATRWRFNAADPDAPPEKDTLDVLLVPTDLTSDRILESFASPKAIGFWDLPAFIDKLEASGFSSLQHRMHYQSELTKPLLFAAMVLIGAAFSMRHVRFGGVGLMLLGATLTGFALFFVSDITQALGASGAIPTLIAAWVPPTAAALLAMGLLLHLEDG